MEMPQPTDAHMKLQKLAGRWSGEERLMPSPWDPKGGTAVGKVQNRVSLDGFIVVQDYEQVRGGAVTFRGHGIFSWSQEEQCYIMYWFDSMGMAPNVFRGNFQNGILTLTNKNSQGFSRAIWDLREGNRHTFRMEGSQDGTTWQTFMEGNYSLER